MKSGTNWMGSLLNNHPQIRCLGEFHWQEAMGPAYRWLENDTLYGDDRFKRETIREFERAIQRCMRRAAGDGPRWIGDRTPTTLEPLVFHDAPYISMLRDGRDVLVSRAFHLFNNPHVTRLFEKHPSLHVDLQRFRQNPWYFHESPERLLANEELVTMSARWWRQHLEADRHTTQNNRSLQVLTVRYEDLHRNVVQVMDSVYRFLGADPNQAQDLTGELLPGFATERPNEFFRKGAIGDWRQYFGETTRSWFNREAGEELQLQGYCESQDW